MKMGSCTLPGKLNFTLPPLPQWRKNLSGKLQPSIFTIFTHIGIVPYIYTRAYLAPKILEVKMR